MTLATMAGPTAAQELSWSGFGTVGVARSNRDFNYQRYINRDASLARDTLFGLQADLQLNPQWSATVQVKAAPSLDHDSRWDLVPAWAFVAWRPANDWLLRLGRARAPLYLYSESMDVGQTHDMARLPTELYSISPTTDFDGASVNRTWTLGDQGERELSVDLYSGSVDTSVRFFASQGLPPVQPAGAGYQRIKGRISGLAMTFRQPDLLLRASLHRASASLLDGARAPVSPPYVSLGPGLGYYQVSNALPGPGLAEVDRVRNTVFSLGAELGLVPGWRLTGEYVRNRQHDTEFGSDAAAYYLALFRPIGRFTPYLSVSRLSSRELAFDWFARLTDKPLPDAIPGAAQINAIQRLTAESFWLADQRSVAVGSSYTLSPTTKLKAEWLRSRIGRVSRLVDTPLGGATPRNTSIEVLSVNLSFAF